MLDDKVRQIIPVLENQELEAENKIESPEFYIQLFAAYLYINDLSNARYLWKRIPKNIQAQNKELENLHKIFICLVNNDSKEFFKEINYDWSESIKEVMAELKGKVRFEALDLIGKAYSSIFENNLMELTNTLPEELTELCHSLNWHIEEGSFPRLIYPVIRKEKKIISTTHEEQLITLTDTVSFLEN